MKEVSKLLKRKKNYIAAYCGALLLAALLGCSAKNSKPDPTPSPIPTVTESPTKELSGFDAANPQKVQAKRQELQSITALTVGDTTITMERAMVLIYFMEVRGNYYAAYYDSMYGTDYWSTVYDESGKTTREVFKDEVIDTLIKYAILYDCAVKNEVTLTAEETKENADYVDRVIAALTAEETERGGFTKENLIETCAWMTLAEKYYDKMTQNLGIDRETVRKSIDPQEYKEYETEYLYLATTYYDEQFEICQMTEAEVAERMERMKECYSLVQEGNSFSEIMECVDLVEQKTRLFREDGSGAEVAYAEAAKKLADGEVCGPIQTEYGIYLIRMVNRNCTKSYEEAVDAAYELERSTAFQKAYEVLLEGYTIEKNEAAWADIIIGEMVNLAE